VFRLVSVRAETDKSVSQDTLVCPVYIYICSLPMSCRFCSPSSILLHTLDLYSKTMQYVKPPILHFVKNLLFYIFCFTCLYLLLCYIPGGGYLCYFLHLHTECLLNCCFILGLFIYLLFWPQSGLWQMEHLQLPFCKVFRHKKPFPPSANLDPWEAFH
jgi:hypothetical protein